MTVLAFRRHGRQRVDRITAVLQQRVDHWRTQWAAEPGSCHAQPLAELAPDTDGRWWACRTNHIHLCLPEQGAAALGSALAVVMQGQDNALAAAIGRRAVLDLMAELGAANGEAGTLPNAAQLDRRHGVLGFTLELPGTVAALYLPIGICDAMAPPAVEAAPLALAPRRSALLASTTRLVATLDLGDAPLDAASNLQPGEILGGSRIADAVVRVQDAAGNTVFTAHLQSSDGRKALRCTHVEHQPGKE
jgi:hypothetical protein